ncbi:hypothetical protein [Arthrobacter sp. UKPF54-2]|uniref:hypothetical protein n=1 Tax=Arthrobacter sp. UKPF54-2 TaxID=2600159 RepID=UPI0021BDD36F|nr:hypothetical protein [Arthrobacter sp. UKPF54-2]
MSPLFSSIKGAAAGITAVRENAATGLVVDHSAAKTPGRPGAPSKPAAKPAAAKAPGRPAAARPGPLVTSR